MLIVMALAVHTWFPEVLAWLKPDFKASIAVALFAFLVDRILLIYRDLSAASSISVFKVRGEAYKHLVQLIQKYGCSSIDLIQFSGQTALPLLRSIAETENKVKVRLFLADREQAIKFDVDRSPERNFHFDRIVNTIDTSRLLCEDHKNCSIEILLYSPPASVSAVVIDDWIVSMGWIYCFQDKDLPSILRVRGHAAPAINAIGSAAQPLLGFVKEQIGNLEKHAKPTVATQHSLKFPKVNET